MEAQTTAEDTWALIESGIGEVFGFDDTRSSEVLSTEKYMEYYTAVHNYCMGSNTNQTQVVVGPRAHTSGAKYIGRDVYERLSRFIETYLTDISQSELTGHTGLALLERVKYQWSRFTFSGRVVNNICGYLNRHWISRELQEGHDNVHKIYAMELIKWKEIVFVDLSMQCASALLEEIEKDRNGESTDSNLLRLVIETFLALGSPDSALNDPAHVGDEDEMNAYYREHFEGRFIDMTRSYYYRESEQFLEENPVTEYVKKVNQRIEEEEKRLQLYIPKTTSVKLMSTLDDVLITAHLHRFQGELKKLLDHDRTDDLRFLYNLLVRLPNGVDALRDAFEEHVKACGLRDIAEVANTAFTDPKLYVEKILHVYNKYDDFVSNAFRNSHLFKQALDKACRAFINANAVTEKAGSSSNKGPELIARYCDQLLKKTARAVETELETVLFQIMIVFNYIDDKDVFQKFYSKLLSKRLIAGVSASEDAEELMISKLKQACGIDYTAKLHRMFNDMGLSRDINSEFHSKMDGRINIDFSILVLTTSAWPPTKAQFKSYLVPEELSFAIAKFTEYYQVKFNGRVLSWVYHMSKGELKTGFTKPQTYTLQVSTYQIAILLLFNRQDTIHSKEISQDTGIPEPHLKNIMEILVKSSLLKDAGDGNYSINRSYKSNRVRVNLNMPIKAEQKVERDETHQHVLEDRKHYIQACVVRVMKARKQMVHSELVTEVINQLKSRFQPSVPMIKKNIGVLLEKEYLERAEDQKDLYRYKA